MSKPLFEILDSGSFSTDDLIALVNWAPSTIVAHPRKYLSERLANTVKRDVAIVGTSGVIRVIQRFRRNIGKPHIVRKARR